MRGPPVRKKYAFLFHFLIKTAVTAAALAVLFTCVLAVFRMSGNNMFPSIRDGDLCIFYRLEDCTLKDIVLFAKTDGELQAGRIVAVAGQVVDFPEEGGYLLDGYQPSEEIFYPTYAEEESDVSYPLEIPEDSFFILNDFRSDTGDSRRFSMIKKEQIKGKLIFLLRRRGF